MNQGKLYDWESFDIVFYYDAHITKVFSRWTTARGLETFLVDRCVFLNERGEGKDAGAFAEPGDQYQWYFRHDLQLEGKVTGYEEKKRFSFTLGNMHVDLFFKVVENQTEVQLVQSAIPDTPEGRIEGHLNYRSCWIFFMTNLASVLTTATDLRHQNPALAASMEVGFLPLSHR